MFEDQDRQEPEQGSYFVGPTPTPHEFTPDGMTFFLAGMSYARKGGTLSEFQRIIARLLAEANLNDDVGIEAALYESTIASMSSTSSPKASKSDHSRNVQPHPHQIVPRARPPLDLTSSVATDIKNDLAKSVFDTCKLRNGREWGNVSYGELARIEKVGIADAVAATQDAKIAAALRKRGVADHGVKVRDFVSPRVFAAIVKKAQS